MMKSPWLHELKRLRPVSTLLNDTTTDVTVVGAGIAGIATSFFTLKYTQKNLLLVDSFKVAHGATGHNAGQITSYFERPFTDIVAEFGLAKAVAGQRAIEGAWTLLDEMLNDAQLTTPLFQVTGYAGFTSEQKIIEHLKNNALKIQGGIIPEAMYIATEWLEHNPLPKVYSGLYSVIPQADVLDMLETRNTDYIACIQGRKGCTNSARICEELVGWMLRTYPARFALAEHTHIKRIQVQKPQHILHTDSYTIRCESVVLCTNGFEHFSIEDANGSAIDTRFHAMIHGTIGYMVGHVHEINADPTAKSYFPKERVQVGDVTEPDAYFYLTRRPFEASTAHPTNLICIGGPEERLSDTAQYSRDLPHAKTALADVSAFLKETTMSDAPNEFAFQWHGLMGYTPNAIRRVGPDPACPSLYYNLGCNGIGILPSIFGGRRISQYIAGETLEPSLFDIPNQ